MSRRYRFGELNPFRRRNRRPFNASTYSITAQKNHSQFASLSPSINADIGKVMKVEVLGIWGYGPLDADNFPTLAAGNLEEYGPNIDDHPLYFHVWIGAPEPTPTAPPVLLFSDSHQDNNPLLETYVKAIWHIPFSGQPMTSTEIPFKKGDQVFVRFFNNITGAEPMIIDIVKGGTAVRTAGSFVSPGGSYESIEDASDVSSSSTDETESVDAPPLDPGIFNCIPSPLSLGDPAENEVSNNILITGPIWDPFDDQWSSRAGGGTSSQFGTIRENGVTHMGMDVYYLPGEPLYAPVNFIVNRVRWNVYGRGHENYNKDYGRQLHLSLAGNDLSDACSRALEDLVIVLMHIKDIPDELTAAHSAYVAKGTLLGYNYYVTPEFISGRGNFRGTRTDEAGLRQHKMPGGSPAHIHFEVRPEYGVRTDPTGVIDASSFRKSVPLADGLYMSIVRGAGGYGVRDIRY